MLFEMSESVIAGLKKNQMHDQKDRMVRQLNAILDTESSPKKLQKKCKLITYDGKKELNMYVFKRHIKMQIYKLLFLGFFFSCA